MSPGQYNPDIHHRRSIRLKGHDYAGGGVYFVTICAHRDAGNIFGVEGVSEMVAKEWESAVGAGLVSAHFMEGGHEARREEGGHEARREEGGHEARREEGGHEARREEGGHEARREEGGHEARPYVIMPDHFHALIEMHAGERSLGDVICAFKSRVVHEYIAGVKCGRWPRFPGKIWHRNYYEMIVRNAEAEEKIAQYIRMNPWRCVMDLGNGLRGMGNPALWNGKKLGILCSHKGDKNIAPTIPNVPAYFSGFHSPLEREIFAKLLAEKRPVIWCPAWGLDGAARNPEVLKALEQNRMLILEMRNRDGDLAAAEERNRFVLQHADRLWLPHVTPGGMIDRLVKAAALQTPDFKNKIIHHTNNR